MNNESMRSNVDAMLAFTHAYQSYAPTDICRREAACLRVQLLRNLRDRRPGDLLVGRKFDQPIGFLPQTSYCGVGYYCDIAVLDRWAVDDACTPKEREDIEALKGFWKGNTTQDRICRRYPQEIWEGISHQDYMTSPGVAFPLYRISGAQMDTELLLQLGLDGMIDRVKCLVTGDSALREGLISALETLREICLHYEAQARRRAEQLEGGDGAEELAQLAGHLRHIAHSPPKGFWQAMQLMWLFYLASGTFNYGRMDDVLGPFLAADLASGAIGREQALNLIVNLWQLIEERETIWDGRVVLGGRGRRHPEEADAFALLALEATRLHRGVLPQLTLRCHAHMNPELMDMALTSIGEGTTYPLLYNDDANIPAVMRAFSVDESTAEQYIPFGCGEYVIFNQSFGTPSGTLNLLEALNRHICAMDGDGRGLENYASFEAFYAAYIAKLRGTVRLLAQQEKIEYEACANDAGFLFFSLLFDDCLQRQKPAFSGGLRYLGGTLECYGNTNTADSLCAIRQLVFQDKTLPAKKLAQALGKNFEGYEDVRVALLKAPKFGNDDDAADGMAQRLHEDICGMIMEAAGPAGLNTYHGVIINNSMNTTFGQTTGASADGRKAYTHMANANNPTGGMDRSGLTAMFNSMLKLRTDIHAGSVQNLRFSRQMFGALLPKTRSMLEAFFAGGGAQCMITVLDKGDLEEAIINPEKYQNLIVRVGGFSARFVELPPPVQQELLSRNLY